MIGQAPLRGALSQGVAYSSSDFPACIERDMDTLLALLGQ